MRRTCLPPLTQVKRCWCPRTPSTSSCRRQWSPHRHHSIGTSPSVITPYRKGLTPHRRPRRVTARPESARWWVLGAQRAARSLCDAARRRGCVEADFDISKPTLHRWDDQQPRRRDHGRPLPETGSREVLRTEVAQASRARRCLSNPLDAAARHAVAAWPALWMRPCPLCR